MVFKAAQVAAIEPGPPRDIPMRLEQLDALRGVAAMLVVIYHFGYLPSGNLGVHLFFVISGFVIGLTAGQGRDVVDFAASRLVRLFPAYWLSIPAAWIALSLIGDEPSLSVLLCSFSMAPVLVCREPYLIDPYWTLPLELVFYSAVTCLLALRALRWTEIACLAWLTGASVFRIAEMAGYVSSLSPRMEIIAMPNFGHLFIIGVMIHRLRAGGGLQSAIVLIAALLFSFFGRDDWDPMPPLLSFVSTCVIAAAVFLAASGRLKWIGTAPMVTIGLISYSLYLLHEPVRRPLVHYGEFVGAPDWLISTVGIGLSLLVAYGSWRLVERPLQRWYRNRRQPPNARLDPPDATA